MLQKYKDYLKCCNYADNTVRLYLKQAEKLVGYLDGKEVTWDAVHLYLVRLSSYSPVTQNLYIIAINHYLDWNGHPELRQRTKRVQCRQSLDNVLSIGEYRRLLQCAREAQKEKYYLIMRTMAGTGIRVGELAYFTVESVKNRHIVVYNKGKYREVYASDYLMEKILAYCRNNGIESGCIFLGRGNAPLNVHSIWEMLKKLARQAKVPEAKVYPHSFRHLFAKTYMEQYGNLAELASLLGHSSLEMTRIYTLTSGDEKRRALGQMGL